MMSTPVERGDRCLFQPIKRLGLTSVVDLVAKDNVTLAELSEKLIRSLKSNVLDPSKIIGDDPPPCFKVYEILISLLKNDMLSFSERINTIGLLYSLYFFSGEVRMPFTLEEQEEIHVCLKILMFLIDVYDGSTNAIEKRFLLKLLKYPVSSYNKEMLTQSAAASIAAISKDVAAMQSGAADQRQGQGQQGGSPNGPGSPGPNGANPAPPPQQPPPPAQAPQAQGGQGGQNQQNQQPVREPPLPSAIELKASSLYRERFDQILALPIEVLTGMMSADFCVYRPSEEEKKLEVKPAAAPVDSAKDSKTSAANNGNKNNAAGKGGKPAPPPPAATADLSKFLANMGPKTKAWGVDQALLHGEAALYHRFKRAGILGGEYSTEKNFLRDAWVHGNYDPLMGSVETQYYPMPKKASNGTSAGGSNTPGGGGSSAGASSPPSDGKGKSRGKGKGKDGAPPSPLGSPDRGGSGSVSLFGAAEAKPQPRRRQPDIPDVLKVQPQFSRVKPPLLEVGEDELQWVNEDDGACLLWDTDMLTKLDVDSVPVLPAGTASASADTKATAGAGAGASAAAGAAGAGAAGATQPAAKLSKRQQKLQAAAAAEKSAQPQTMAARLAASARGEEGKGANGAKEDDKSGGTPTQQQALELFVAAFESPLTPPQQQRVGEALRENPQLFMKRGQMNASTRFPKLVESSPVLAIESLSYLLRTPDGPEYLKVLVNMRVSWHTIEVVNRLTTTPNVNIPKEFIHLYITNCIETCGNISDKYMQNRLVRLFCAFLQSLLRNNIVKAEDVFAEVQSFCVEFSNNKEAASLYQLFQSQNL